MNLGGSKRITEFRNFQVEDGITRIRAGSHYQNKFGSSRRTVVSINILIGIVQFAEPFADQIFSAFRLSLPIAMIC